MEDSCDNMRKLNTVYCKNARIVLLLFNDVVGSG